MQTLLLRFAAVLTVIALGSVMIDLAVTTDEERLQALADELCEGEPGVDELLRFAKLEQLSVEVVHGDESQLYDERDELDFVEDVREALAPIADGHEVVQRAVNLDDQGARIDLRLMDHGETANLHVRLVKQGEGWALRRIRRS